MPACRHNNIFTPFMSSGGAEDSGVSFRKAFIRSSCAILIDSTAELEQPTPDRQRAENEAADSFMP